MKKIIFSCVLLLILAGLFAAGSNKGWWKAASAGPDGSLPEARQEYLRVLQQYKDRDTSIDLAGTIHIYDGEQNNVMKEQSGFRMIRQGRQYYMQLSYLQTFCDGIVTVQLDTVGRTITFSNPVGDTAKEKGIFDLIFTDTAGFTISGSVSPQGADRTLHLKSDFNPGIQSFSLTYDTASYRLSKAEIVWWKNSSPQEEEDGSDKVWLTKIDYHYQPFHGLDLAEMVRKIVNVKDGHVVPTEHYKDYQLKISSN